VSRAPSWPDDIERLKQRVSAQRAEILERDRLIGKLRMQLARLKRMQFGRSSEQLDGQIAQLELTLEELEASATEPARWVPASSTAPQPERARPVRRPLPTRTGRARP